MEDSFNWSCPHCQQHVTISNVIGKDTILYFNNADGRHCLTTTFIVCPNPNCQKFTLNASLYRSAPPIFPGGNEEIRELVKRWQLVPESTAKVFPDYIPAALIQDYKEACAIRCLSPKASATLSRRCLQGILRDFWKVKPGNLVAEIKQIEGKIDPLTWAAIDATRKIGNIGAHMEKDIGLIIDVEENEADLLINLIEMLFNDFYVVRAAREARLKSIVSVSKKKDEQKKGEGD